MQWTQRDGDRVRKGALFGEVRGSARSILTAERIALNFMQRMSGIATATREMVEAVQVGAQKMTQCTSGRANITMGTDAGSPRQIVAHPPHVKWFHDLRTCTRLEHLQVHGKGS